MPASSEIISFEDFRFDRAGGGLFRCDALGALAPVEIGSRALDILAVLVERQGEIVPKSEIIAAAWPGTFVAESNLFVQIAALRRTLDKGRAGQSCIQTISGRGYRFIGPVERSPVGLDRRASFGLHDRDAQPPLISVAERRQLTVMLCEVIGLDDLSSRLDPEELGEIVGRCRRTVATLVDGLDGSVCNYVTEAMLAYFGFPQAHEDDAERAVRAGLGIVEAISRLELGSIKLQARIGIATGLVVVGDLIGEDPAHQSVVGETPHLADRLKGSADPGMVVIAASTRRLVGNLFEYRELGPSAAADHPMPAWRVLRPRVVSRFEALRGPALQPLVGRDDEVDLLMRRWARARAGEGQVLLISGEPGIGKSRIVAELGQRLSGEPHLRLRYYCSPYYQDSALFPVIDQIGRAAGFAPDDPPETRLEKLEALLARAGPQNGEVALVADLLSLPESGRNPLPKLSAQRKKERTFEALLRQLEGLAAREPVLVVFEDVHWIDPTSRELLDLCVACAPRLPMLLIITFRHEFQPAWTGHERVGVLALNRLDRRDRTALAAQIAGGKALPREVVAQIVDRTDGIPLFIEELTKSILESGLLREEPDRYVLDRALPRLSIPTTLHALLVARLDRLSSVRQVAQIGAAIGREFSYPLLRAVSPLSDDELGSALARLVASGLVSQRGTVPEAAYTFKHALVQDAAHGSLLRSARQRLHGQIAEALGNLAPELREVQPELFAQHYAEAGRVDESIAFWRQAGRRSAARSAMAEAAAQFQKGLDQLALLPDGPERQRQELELRSSLGVALMVAKGYAAPEAGEAYARARELWDRLGSPSEFLQITSGQSSYHTTRGEFDLALRLDEDLLRLSRRRNDPGGVLLGHSFLGRNLLLVGRLAASRSHLEEAAADRSVERRRSSRVVSESALGITLCCLGFPDAAFARSSAAMAEARRLAHLPYLLLTSGYAIIMLHARGGKDEVLAEWVDLMVAIAAEQGFPYYRSIGAIFDGANKIRTGDATEGIALLRSGLASYCATGALLWTPFFFTLLAEAYEIAGRTDEAGVVLDDALRMINRTEERWFAAEVHRRKGELLRRRDAEAAENLYRRALDIAREQEARLWELRTTASLARLRRDQGRRAEAHDLLAPIYSWFSEGWAAPDLMSVKALLDEFTSC